MPSAEVSWRVRSPVPLMHIIYKSYVMPSVLCHHWLGGRKGRRQSVSSGTGLPRLSRNKAIKRLLLLLQELRVAVCHVACQLLICTKLTC